MIHMIRALDRYDVEETYRVVAADKRRDYCSEVEIWILVMHCCPIDRTKNKYQLGISPKQDVIRPIFLIFRCKSEILKCCDRRK
jgi:hypothetical protein